ncbi:uncharacterized protein LOC128887279 isoform X1 [Hylaeus anthracinus]|uniref:uncharacterized protein LOC128887279 isoform X1 n=1 Tax=Hylaeus anthracinus TaxID=313031 RepID=UPI0023B89D2E|nr:uncharacterized protein LOC128887279 isoform X1 [Hylaeus anthracinus]
MKCEAMADIILSKRKHPFFNPAWEERYLFTTLDSGPVCLVCHKEISHYRKFNFSRHYNAFHANAYAHYTYDKRKAEVRRLKAQLAEEEELINLTMDTADAPWETKYFFTKHDTGLVCLVCHKKMSHLKQYNFQRHYNAFHASAYADFTHDKRVAEVQRLKVLLAEEEALLNQENGFFNPSWETLYFFTKYEDGLICLVCFTMVYDIRKYNLERHYNAFHVNTYAKLTHEERLAEVEKLKAKLAEEEEELAYEMANQKQSRRRFLGRRENRQARLERTEDPASEDNAKSDPLRAISSQELASHPSEPIVTEVSAKTDLQHSISSQELKEEFIMPEPMVTEASIKQEPQELEESSTQPIEAVFLDESIKLEPLEPITQSTEPLFGEESTASEIKPFQESTTQPIESLFLPEFLKTEPQDSDTGQTEPLVFVDPVQTKPQEDPVQTKPQEDSVQTKPQQLQTTKRAPKPLVLHQPLLLKPQVSQELNKINQRSNGGPVRKILVISNKTPLKIQPSDIVLQKLNKNNQVSSGTGVKKIFVIKKPALKIQPSSSNLNPTPELNLAQSSSQEKPKESTQETISNKRKHPESSTKVRGHTGSLEVLFKGADMNEKFGQYVTLELQNLAFEESRRFLKARIRKAIQEAVEFDESRTILDDTCVLRNSQNNRNDH